MNPHQKNKVDINSLSADEQRLFRLYGKLPNKKDLLQNKLKERKYFDSGDYALSKAGKASDSGMTNIGTEHPSADNIPHMSPLTQQLTNSGANSISAEGAGYGYVGRDGPGSPPMLPGAGMHRGSINGIPGGGLPGATSRSPVKESSFLARTESMNQDTEEGDTKASTEGEGSVSSPPRKEGIPIRR